MAKKLGNRFAYNLSDRKKLAYLNCASTRAGQRCYSSLVRHGQSLVHSYELSTPVAAVGSETQTRVFA